MATFGTTTEYSYWNEGVHNYCGLVEAPLSEDGDVSKLSVYTANEGSACYIKGVIYAADGSSGMPYTLKGTTAAVQISNGSVSWRDLTFESAVALTAGDYWIGIIGDSNAANLAIYASGSGPDLLLYSDTYSDGPMSPISGSPVGTFGVGPWSIYATYTASASTTGSGAIQTAAATASGSGTVSHSGSGAVETAPAALDGSGSVAYSGSGAVQTAAAHISGAGTVDTGADVSRVRIRAVDSYSKTSGWVTSAAFTVIDNSAPAVSLVSPTDDSLTSGNAPYIILGVSDADGDDVHVEVQLSLRPDFDSGLYLKTATAQSGWEEASDPYESWMDLPEAGATTGNRVRYQTSGLRYDVYWLRYRATDGILWSDWSAPISFRVTPSGELPLTCTIDGYSYNIMGLQVTERTGGEASPFSFRVPLSILATQPIARSASVSIGFAIGAQSRVWNGTVEGLVSEGAEVTVNCVQDDAYLARKLVTGDETSDDVGAILAAFVASYGSPLTNDHMDITLGVTTAIKGNYQTLLEHLRTWAQLLGLILFVDSDGEVHLTDPDDIADPTYILYEGYE